jgi:hypothetical protein
MTLHLLFPFALFSAASSGSVDLPEAHDPVADPSAVVVSGNARFTVLTPAMLRMEWSPDGTFEDRASLVFVHRRLPVPRFSVNRTDGWLAIGTEELTLRYREGSGRFDKDNLSITLMLNDKPVTWRPGLEDRGNLRGTYRTLDTVSGATVLSPGLLSRDGWVVVDDSARLLFDHLPQAAGGSPPQGRGTAWPTPRPNKRLIDWYFLGYGHNCKRALGDFTEVAGRIPLPPRFAFGTWWSRYWAYSDAELRRLVQEFDEHEVPLDVLVIDMDWHLDGWTGYTWNPKYFPDPAGFLKWVHAQGLRATLNLHPASGVKKHEQAFPEVARAMGLDPGTTDYVPFDCTDPRYVEAYFKHLHHPLERQGVDFWWIDWQQGQETIMEGLDPLWWLNHLHWTDLERNPERRGKRPLMFSRWGGLGNHRYQIGFSGDTYCNWPSLAFQPYFTATAGNVCYPYWSHDIGGHQPGPVEPELYARWIQWGALSPILRTHTTKHPKAERRIWMFPDEVFDTARKAFQLRYALIPYIYTAARQCYDTALPLCRPLYYDWPELDQAYERTDEYLLGDDLLVAPVTRPVDAVSGCAAVRVWLPPGAWTNWFTGRTYTGPASISLQVPLDEIPLFVRSGAVIPMQPPMRRTDEKPLDPLILHIWPGESGSTRVYEDDGETVGYQEGECTWTAAGHSLANGIRRITVGPAEGSFPGMVTGRRYEIHLRDVWPPAEVTVDGSKLPQHTESPEAGWQYEHETLSTVIRLPRRSVHRATEVLVVPQRTETGEPHLRNGLRGQLRRIRDAAALLSLTNSADVPFLAELQEMFTAKPVCVAETIDTMRRAAGHLVKTIDSSDLEPATKRQALTRLLGLQCSLEVTAVGPDESRLQVTGVVALSPPGGALRTASARLLLMPPANWSIDGKSEWSWPELALDRPSRVLTKLLPDGPPQTTVLQSEFTLRADDLELQTPTRQVLFPSINRWWLVGPFPATPPTALDEVFPPERGLDVTATYQARGSGEIGWRRVERQIAPADAVADEFFVNLLEVFGTDHTDAVAYALTYLWAPNELEASLAFGSDDGIAIWLNGEEIHRHSVGRPYQAKEDRIPVQLEKGDNALLLKISQYGGGWGFGVHVETPGGEPLTEVTAHLHPSGRCKSAG